MPRRSRRAAAVALVVLLVAACVCSPALSAQPSKSESSNTPIAPPQVQGYKVVFDEHFDTSDAGAGVLHDRGWYPGVWYNAKQAPAGNIWLDGSVLSLVWTRGQEAPDTSLTTLSREKKQWKAWRYGYFEARLRWDVVKGAWPAFWLIPVQPATDQDNYNGTRRSGEIDIFEGQGDHPHTFYGTIHEWVNNRHDHPSKNNAFALPRHVDLSQFHVYGLLWTPGTVTWYLDNRRLHSERTPAVFDKQDFFVVLSMQQGVNWKYGDMSGVTANSMKMQVDWVRVWQR